MEDLTKQQLVLLTLLVSFVTSIATSIIAVSLLQQAPQTFTQTVNRVVERTVERVVPDTSKPNTITVKETVVVKEEDLVIESIDKNSKSIARISGEGNIFIGLGLVVSQGGVIAVDRESVVPQGAYTVTMHDGKTLPATVLQAGNASTAYLKITKADNDQYAFHSASFGNSNNLKLGQSMITISGEGRNTIATGRVSELATATSGTGTTTATTVTGIETDIVSKDQYLGGPLLNLNGEVVGMKLSLGSSFVPANQIKAEVAAALNPANSAQ